MKKAVTLWSHQSETGESRQHSPHQFYPREVRVRRRIKLRHVLEIHPPETEDMEQCEK
jgi:hypothetical protein